jgi:hypothetical protein
LRAYAAELSPRIRNGEPLFFDDPALRGVSNTLGTLVPAAIVTQRILEFMFSLRPMLRAITTDFSDVPAKLNQRITTRTVAMSEVKDLGSAAAGGTTSALSISTYLLTRPNA